MARKFYYEARFSDGSVITRATERVYTHAYKVTYATQSGQRTMSGFSGSKELAEKATRSASNSKNWVGSQIVEVHCL
jgi:hypothetical protein